MIVSAKMAVAATLVVAVTLAGAGKYLYDTGYTNGETAANAVSQRNSLGQAIDQAKQVIVAESGQRGEENRRASIVEDVAEAGREAAVRRDAESADVDRAIAGVQQRAGAAVDVQPAGEVRSAACPADRSEGYRKAGMVYADLLDKSLVRNKQLAATADQWRDQLESCNAIYDLSRQVAPSP